MKLPVPFLQLPLAFDAVRLSHEVEALGESAWKPHPLGYAGNDALSLISVGGDPASDEIRGPMQPTPLLLRCPYLMQVLGEIGAVWGRSRLMRLSGHAEVTPHADINYYWRERMRVHVPITTQPTVRFICGDQEVNMAAGECWIFDTWRMHRVINDQSHSRIHLVADTVGGERFWKHAAQARALGPARPDWRTRFIVPDQLATSALRFEKTNVPTVMSPWELRHHVTFLFSEVIPHANLPVLQQCATRFFSSWQALWAEYGEGREGWPEYRAALDAFVADVRRFGADMRFQNGNMLPFTMAAIVFKMALADHNEQTGGEIRAIAGQNEVLAPAPIARSPAASDPLFDRPIFIVSSPRSGSTLLFETLARTPGLYTPGDESHVQIEGIAALHPSARDFESNQLDASQATEAIAAELRQRFYSSLRDRTGAAPAAGRVRMLEKTPKNALRIPFLAQVFPDAHFVYLYRDPRQVLASMLEAWESGRFRTYPKLAGWTGPPWSLLLVPGWRELNGLSLIEVVARQWERTTRLMLDDLEAIPAKRRSIIRYDAFLKDPQSEVERLGKELGLGTDLPSTDVLPLSKYTLSAPAADKWRRHEREIDAVWPLIEATSRRAESVVGS